MSTFSQQVLPKSQHWTKWAKWTKITKNETEDVLSTLTTPYGISLSLPLSLSISAPVLLELPLTIVQWADLQQCIPAPYLAGEGHKH